MSIGRDPSGDFWSRRRAGVAAEAEAEETAQIQAEREAREAEIEAEAAEKTDAEILAELGLTDPDEMQAGDDFKAFLQEAVPARLRKRALRALWRSNPVLANVDNLVDYGQDFSDKAMVMENLQTAYQVGKGMLRHVEAMAAKAEAEALKEVAALEAPEEADIALQEAPEPAEIAAAEAPEPEVEEASYDQSIIDDEATDSGPFVYKRMQFDFPDEEAGPDREKGDA